jgi:phenylalanyl-tRNA synthetase beta chain
MKLSPHWIRDYVDLAVDDRRLAEDLTNVGIAVEGVSGSGADTVWEMEIGTNRPDAMNHYGVGREAAAIYDVPLKAIQPKLPKCPQGLGLHIEINELSLCPRFTARIIRGTEVCKSETFVTHRLELLDQRPISNAVDATNYVLWEIGKPTHVYDMDLLEGGKLIVRKARNGETLKTLDGVERRLTAEDLVVCDAKKPVGLAGVMGGYDTMITEKTRNIVIESAWWDPITVRKMSRRHGIHTDASHRFERGADFESTILSCDLVAHMILESGGGELTGDVVDVVSKEMDQAPVLLRVSEVKRILGGDLEAGQIFRLLKRLGFTLVPEGQGDSEKDAQFRVSIPSWRLDVEREIDVIEEIARLHGYDKFANTLPAYSGAVVELPHAAIDATLRQRALALGYNEALSLTFISHADAEIFDSEFASASAAKAAYNSASDGTTEVMPFPSVPLRNVPFGARVLELENPQSEEASVMRTSLVPGMLDMLAWNLNRDVAEVRLFEMGSVYEYADGERVEPRRFCLGATLSAVKNLLPVGSALDMSKGERANAAEAFRGFKGDVENLLAAFAGDAKYDRQTAEYFHRGRSARALVNNSAVVQFGQIDPGIAAARKLRQDVFVAEFDLQVLYELGLHRVEFRPLARYPEVERDFSFVFLDGIPFIEMRRVVSALNIRELRDFRPAEIFRGASIGAGKYSILLRAKFQSEERTLRDDEIAQWSGKIVAALTALGGVQRA